MEGALNRFESLLQRLEKVVVAFEDKAHGKVKIGMS